MMKKQCMHKTETKYNNIIYQVCVFLHLVKAHTYCKGTPCKCPCKCIPCKGTCCKGTPCKGTHCKGTYCKGAPCKCTYGKGTPFVVMATAGLEGDSILYVVRQEKSV